MIVDALETRDLGADVERSARFRWAGGEFRLRLRVPAEHAGPAEDGSPFLSVAIQLAMRIGEDLELDAPVSPLLRSRCEEIQRVLRAYWPALRPAELRDAGDLNAAPPPAGRGLFFSRGVDSTYSAAVAREEPLTALVFCDGLEPNHDERTRAEEIRIARGVAEDVIGLPLVVCETNVRELVDPFVPDWEDFLAGGLALVAHGLARTFGRLLIAPSDDHASLEPTGSHPLLDALYSTERTAIAHDSLALTRMGKVSWLARERPDLIAGLKVCYKESTTGNCGRCGKCLHLFSMLEAAGVLELAEHAPAEVDLDLVARNRPHHLKAGRDWTDIARALAESGRNDRLKEAILESVRKGSLSATGRSVASIRAGSFRDHWAKTALSLLVDGAAYPYVDGGEPGTREDLVGLVRLLDRDSGRHLYSIGGPLRAEVVGELGALHVGERPGTLPVGLRDGLITVAGRDPERVPASAAARLRWAVAPLAWREADGPRRRLAATLARVGHLVRRPGPPAGPTTGRVAYIHSEHSAGRLALYAALHPVTGDQLLSTSRWEPIDLGYGEPVLLGYLEPVSPTTGLLGTERPRLPWATRFGQRVRED